MEYDAEMALYTLRFVLVCIGDDAVDRGTATGTATGTWGFRYRCLVHPRRMMKHDVRLRAGGRTRRCGIWLMGAAAGTRLTTHWSAARDYAMHVTREKRNRFTVRSLMRVSTVSDRSVRGKWR